jgi:hypothetical protein
MEATVAFTITSYTPNTGPVGGGTLVTVTGTGLNTVADVLVGNLQVPIVSQTSTTLTFYTPAVSAAGNQTVYLTDDTTITAASPAFSYTATASAENLVSTLARKWKLDVDISAGQDGTGYIPVRAIMDFAPAITATMQDDSTYDQDGYVTNVKTALAWKNTVKLARKAGISSGSYDAGQEALRAAHDKFGSAGVVRVRWYDRDGTTEAYEGYANVEWTEDGGNMSAVDTVSCVLTGNGSRSTITNPVGH